MARDREARRCHQTGSAAGRVKRSCPVDVGHPDLRLPASSTVMVTVRALVGLGVAGRILRQHLARGSVVVSLRGGLTTKLSPFCSSDARVGVLLAHHRRAPRPGRRPS